MASSEVSSSTGTNGRANSNSSVSTRDSSMDNRKATPPRNTPRSAPTPEFHAVIAPTSPTYPPYGATYIDPSQLAAAATNAYEVSGDPVNLTYVYPVSPQFSVQYYPDYSNGYQSYPGSPSLHPQSPSINPTSPPFSPTLQYQQVALSPPTHAYVLPSHSTQPFPPLHITSPILTGRTSLPSSPPHQYLPGPYIIHTDNRSNKKHNQHHNNSMGGHPHPQHHHQQPRQHYQFFNNHQEIQPEDAVDYHTHNIYVRGLSSSTTDESFLEMCQVYGDVASSKAIIDQKTGECKGYGFAMFNNEKECEEAITGLNKAGLQASYARVGQESFSSRLKNLQDETSTNIYISNLPLDYTEEKLEELFQPYRTVSNRILRDPQSGLSRGVGFARMSDRQAASAIIDKFNGHTIEGSSAPLQVRFADSPAQKKLKSQTARNRRVVRPREFQPMATFAMRPIMPITPETMLGIAPANPASTSHHAYFTDHPQFAAHILPRPIFNSRQQQQPPVNKHASSVPYEQNDLAEDMQKKINITETPTN